MSCEKFTRPPSCTPVRSSASYVVLCWVLTSRPDHARFHEKWVFIGNGFGTTHTCPLPFFGFQHIPSYRWKRLKWLPLVSMKSVTISQEPIFWMQLFLQFTCPRPHPMFMFYLEAFTPENTLFFKWCFLLILFGSFWSTQCCNMYGACRLKLWYPNLKLSFACHFFWDTQKQHEKVTFRDVCGTGMHRSLNWRGWSWDFCVLDFVAFGVQTQLLYLSVLSVEASLVFWCIHVFFNYSMVLIKDVGILAIKIVKDGIIPVSLWQKDHNTDVSGLSWVWFFHRGLRMDELLNELQPNPDEPKLH